MDKEFEIENKLEGEKCGNGVRLNEYEKPFTQTEVHYSLTATDLQKRCAACKFFKHKNNYDPCLIVTNDAPLPIVEGGTCDWFEPIEVRAPDPMPVEIVSITEISFEDDYEMGQMAAYDAADEETDDEEKPKGKDKVVSADDLRRLPELLRKLYYPPNIIVPSYSIKLNPDEFDAASGFKLIRTADKVAWVGWYSNNFQDKERDIFAESGFDFYNKMTADGVWPMPELWCMHQKYLKHGKALKTMRLGHFQIAVGVFDDPSENPLVEKFIGYYDENPVTMSHGFYYNKKDYVNKVFSKFRTFEVSTVKPGREANNHYTGLELSNAET